MRFGAVLKRTRKHAGFSQERIAEVLHMSRSCISKLENDKKTLDAETLIQWAQATSSQNAVAALICGVDVATVLQSITTLIGGLALWI